LQSTYNPTSNLIYIMNTSEILDKAKQIISGSERRNEKLQSICELLDEKVDVFDWTGFYLVAEDEENMLELGPYVGEATDHTRIPFGKGICGQAADTLKTFVVQDVNKANNYLACSIHVKSEIVVPILKEEKFVGELDIDSHTKDAISPELQTLCEEICKALAPIF
jgi:L-methionine (R)-S-oxide reductase